MKEEEELGDKFDGGQGRRNGRKRGGERERSRREELSNFFVKVRENVIKVNIYHNRSIDGRAGRGGNWDEVSNLIMSTSPIINGCCISVVSNEHVILKLDKREVIVIGSGMEKGRSDTEEGTVEGPNIFQGIFYKKKIFEADQGLVSIGPPIERDD